MLWIKKLKDEVIFIKTLVFVAISIGTVAMFGVMLICRIWRKNVPVWKLAVISPILTVFGTIGAYVLYFVENHKWGGISFYGSLFMIPLLFIPAALISVEKYSEILDFSAPSVCIMLAINKVNCLRSGCCQGMVLYTDADGIDVRFPSQIVELCSALIIMIVLIIIIKKEKFKGIMYPLFLIIYGVTRFGLNLLRETTPFIWIIPAGNFWSIIAMVIGVVWLVIFFVKKKNKLKNIVKEKTSDI